MQIATKTLQAIEAALEVDQGARFRGLLKTAVLELEDAYRDKAEYFRSHLGASMLGKQCGRELWYSFRWAVRSNHTGRILRLFNRGHLEEARFVALLRLIGVELFQFDENGKQFRISGHSGHYGGSGDGIALHIPDLPAGAYALTEFKTHNDKSFTSLKQKGLYETKYEHWAQMVQYMEKFKLPYGLYLAVNKNDDSLYGEIVLPNPEGARMLEDRAGKIIWMKAAPAKIGNPPSAGYFACRFCTYRGVCHLKEEPDLNCRSCAFSEPTVNGAWFCNNYQQEIPKESLIDGCSSWAKHKDMG